MLSDANTVIETRVCGDCDRSFDFTEGERRFYESRGLQFRPNHCRLCREKRKLRERGIEPNVATCTACGQETALPFLPREDKAILCRLCYNAAQAAESGMSPNVTADSP